ncbi:unnamed protein product [Schistosoma guineensis]|nr:unnamed protein product [Schistosoma guineensis]
MKFSSSSSLSLTVNKLTTKTTPTSVTTTDSCSHVYSINSKFSNSSNPMLTKLNPVGPDYCNKNSNYKPCTTTFRPLRHLINNWPPPQPINPM